MTESTASAPVADWTCSRCEVAISWMADAERPRLPATWAEESGQLYCLACRRDRAGEAATLGLEEGASVKTRQEVSSRARVEFEVKRRPGREDTRIAKACGSSVVAVRKARVRLGMQSNRP